MKGVTIASVIVTLCLGMPSLNVMAQDAPPSQIIRGVVFSINGQVYLVRDLGGRFVRVQVDKNTERERMIIPGEHIEAVVAPDGHVISLKPVQ